MNDEWIDKQSFDATGDTTLQPEEDFCPCWNEMLLER